MITLVRTCPACPEQYDAYRGDRIVGYLRLRWGYFTAQCPDADGKIVFEAVLNNPWVGAFDDDERPTYLRQAVIEIQKWLGESPTGEYEIV